MDFNKFTIKAQEAIQEAVNLVQQQGQQVIEPLHIASGILKCSEQIASFLLQKAGANLENIKSQIDSAMWVRPLFWSAAIWVSTSAVCPLLLISIWPSAVPRSPV